MDAGYARPGANYGMWLATYKLVGYYEGDLWDVDISWSEFKACFGTDIIFWSPRSGMDAGFYEPRSCAYNRLAWPEFADSAGAYNVLRRIDDGEIFESVELMEAGDTVFIDSTVTAGHTYHYRVMSEDGDTLIYTDEMSFGLQKVAGLQFPDMVVPPMTILCDGEYLYVASIDRIKKIDVTDPYNPCVVGTRDLSFLPAVLFWKIRDMTLGRYGGYLYVVGPSDFLVINAVDDNLPITAHMSDFPTPGSECYAVAVTDHVGYIAYVASRYGLVKVNVQYPSDPEIIGYYTGTGASEGARCYAVEAVGGYLYVEFGEPLGIAGYSEIVNSALNAVCTDHDEPICLDHELELAARQDPLSYHSLRGNPTGYYSVGKTNDSTFVVFNTVDPVNPTPLKEFETPWSRFFINDDPIHGQYWNTMNRAYAFDDQYLYVALRRSSTVPFSSVYVFDIYSPEPEPVYALGDPEIGQYKNGSLASWGKYLYYFDQVSDVLEYYQLEVYEKATACDPTLDVAIGPDPIADAYEVGQNVIISWTCTGCPILVGISLVEDINTRQTIDVLRKFDEPNLSANSITWQAEGISPDPDNHTYHIFVEVWNIEGYNAYCSSNHFSIEEELGTGKGGKIPILGYGTDDGKKEEFPLPRLTTLSSNGHQRNYMLFPTNPAAGDGNIILRVDGCKKYVTNFSSMELVAVDATGEYSLMMMDDAPVLKKDGGELLGVDFLLAGKAGEALRGEKDLSIETITCQETENTVEIRPNEQVEFTYRIPAGKEGTERRYLLRYSGWLAVSEDGDGDIPTAFALMAPYPNPFNPVTTLEFHVPRASWLGVRIYDVAGRLVRTLKDGSCKPGIHSLTWDGCNSRGERVSSGVYFCRLAIDGGGEKITRKLVLLH